MKKSSKILLVLAAAAAMTIGAISTVFAADTVIGTWDVKSNGDWYAKDVDGNDITQGWAVNDADQWFYFSNSKAMKNAFVSYEGNYYYMGKDGVMCTGWVEFDKDNKNITLNKATIGGGTIVDTFAPDGTVIRSELGTSGADYKTLWCCFDEHGVMQMDKWVEVDGLWYYMKGAYCIIGNYSVTLPVANGSSTNKVFGFSKNGNMHVNWIPVEKTTNGTAASGQGPYATEGTEATTSVGAYVYYDGHGEQAKAGWNKIGGEWYWFVTSTKYGTVMVANTIVNDGKYDFYFGADGRMVTGVKTFAKGEKCYPNETAFQTYADSANFVTDTRTAVDANAAVEYLFTATKGRFTGITDTGCYYGLADVAHVAGTADTAHTYKVYKLNGVVAATSTTTVALGARFNESFFLVDKQETYNASDSITGTKYVVKYFESGKLIKNSAIAMGLQTLIADKDGILWAGVTANKDVTPLATKYYLLDDASNHFTVGDTQVAVAKTTKWTYTVTIEAADLTKVASVKVGTTAQTEPASGKWVITVDAGATVEVTPESANTVDGQAAGTAVSKTMSANWTPVFGD